MTEPTEGTVATTSLTTTVAPSERRTQLITWFLGAGFLLLIGAYGTLGIYAIAVPPVDGAWTVITSAQKDIKDVLLIVVGILGGAVTQSRQS